MKPFAVTAANTRGREHDDPYLDDDPFQIDRRRILHSAAFRRLQYKTQVFVTDVHDHFRTRLSHTLETTEICRWLCGVLEINSAVGELIALAHDLGHSPFGHAGEQALAELMADHGGFDHNAQSLRVIEYLEHPYPEFRGLNLSYEIRESLAKHCTIYDEPADHPLADGLQAPIEGQVANLADRIAYDCHDLEDAIGAGLVTEADLRHVGLWAEAADGIGSRGGDFTLPAIRRPVLDRLETVLLDDVADEANRRTNGASLADVDDVRGHDGELVGFSMVMQPRVAELEGFLADRVYRHKRVIERDSQARQLIEGLFEAYLADPELLPERYRRRLDEQGPHRVICDYLAGMTDRFCQGEYKRLCNSIEQM
ncbi:MAG: dNTP triphosphohydrolase [Planctomycetota bacterium]|nr:MAG: dNTP triphosphohydrolase [Planctomycetota bacterium]